MFWGRFSSLNILSWKFAFWALFDFMLVTSPLLTEGPTQPRLFFKFISGTSSEKLCSGLCPDHFELSLSSSFFFLILTSKESSEDYLTPNPRILKINENTSTKNIFKKKEEYNHIATFEVNQHLEQNHRAGLPQLWNVKNVPFWDTQCDLDNIPQHSKWSTMGGKNLHSTDPTSTQTSLK